MTVAHAIITSHENARERAHFLSPPLFFVSSVTSHGFRVFYLALRHDARLTDERVEEDGWVGGRGVGKGRNEKMSVENEGGR